ncbi:MAG: hypothetical protein HOC71_14990 [Candidatus Latescibacteria bacterium]|jgi:hypothetical protein|nr:hypothetical protein [Candidatus Latescibacterota bacterium]
MSERDRIAEIEDLTVHEFKNEIQNTIESLKTGSKPGNTIEILAAALNVGLLGEDLKITLERWLQLDLWKEVEENE